MMPLLVKIAARRKSGSRPRQVLCQAGGAPNTRTALRPPNANEFDIA